MDGMGVISKAIDRLPGWAQVIFVIFGVIVSIYGIAHYGFWSFLLHFLFSPTL